MTIGDFYYVNKHVPSLEGELNNRLGVIPALDMGQFYAEMELLRHFHPECQRFL